MKAADYFERLKKLNRLIRSGQTGTPAELAKSMGLSQSHLFRCLKELEQYGMKIHYSRSLKTYFYANENELTIIYSLKIMADNKTKEIIGGMNLLNTWANKGKQVVVRGITTPLSICR